MITRYKMTRKRKGDDAPAKAGVAYLVWRAQPWNLHRCERVQQLTCICTRLKGLIAAAFQSPGSVYSLIKNKAVNLFVNIEMPQRRFLKTKITFATWNSQRDP